MSQLVWITPTGTLGTLPNSVYYQVQLEAIEPTLLQVVNYQLQAGSLPLGMLLSTTGIISGTPASPTGEPITYNFVIRAYTTDHILDREFSFTIDGNLPPEFITPAGSIGTFYSGQFISNYPLIWSNPNQDTWGLQIDYTQFDSCTIALLQGSLPQNVSIDSKGLITGFILPLADVNTWYFEFAFTLQVTNGRYSSLREFKIGVYNLACLTANTTLITADNVFVLASGSATVAPYITTLPQNIGTVALGDYFSFKFDAFDPDNSEWQIDTSLITPAPGYPTNLYPELANLYTTPLNIPYSLTVDPSSGWIYGRISEELVTPPGVYIFGIYAYKKSNVTMVGPISYFTVTTVAYMSPNIDWVSPTGLVYPPGGTIDLGTIYNGAISMLSIRAVPIYSTEVTLQYRVISGILPPGLSLTADGSIIGRPKYSLPTSDWTFTIEAYSNTAAILNTRTFTIHVEHYYNEGYDNLYIKAMPPLSERYIISQLLQSTSIFPTNKIYRPEDSYFGVAKSICYWHCYGLHPAYVKQYVAAMSLNHYRKRLVLGNLKTARAIDTAGNVVYEVVYVDVIDNLVDNDNTSVSKQVLLPYPVFDPATANQTLYVYPNSLDNMRVQVIDQIGQVASVLPLWMTSTQENGSILGYTTAWVIAYTIPGAAGQIKYNIQQFLKGEGIGFRTGMTVFNAQYMVNNQLSWIDFDADRYIIDRSMYDMRDEYALFPDVNILYPAGTR